MNQSTVRCQALLVKLDAMIRKAQSFDYWGDDKSGTPIYCIGATNQNKTRSWTIKNIEQFECNFYIEIELRDTKKEKTLLLLRRDPSGHWYLNPKYQPKLEKVFQAFGV